MAMADADDDGKSSLTEFLQLGGVPQELAETVAVLKAEVLETPPSEPAVKEKTQAQLRSAQRKARRTFQRKALCPSPAPSTAPAPIHVQYANFTNCYNRGQECGCVVGVAYC
jgi:hypothetical protein